MPLTYHPDVQLVAGVPIVVDRYDEDWSLLGWVMLHGHAEILTGGTEHRDAQALLRSRYAQLKAMQIAQHPVIAVRIERTTSWGNLSVPAKSVASLDQLSGGRFMFAIGGGWNVEEMENHGARYDTRFKLLRE